MKKVLLFFKTKLPKWIIFEYNSIYNYIYFWYTKRKANKLHKLTGRRYHVLPANGKLIILDNRAINEYNKAVPKSKRIDIDKLLKSSYYSTSVQGITRKLKTA